MRFLKWLYPGMKVKRWLALALVGGLLLMMGSALLTAEAGLLVRAASLGILALGWYVLTFSYVRMLVSLLDVVSPSPHGELVEIVFKRRQLQKGPKIVVLGGGPGLSTLLSGLKGFTANLTAIVTVADDGGSSGRLREEFGMLPPGDIRNCLVALADVEPLMQQLFQYRFGSDSALRGHNFGNLFITAMTQITGDFQRAIQASSRVLAIRGRVIPSTCDKVRLVAEHDDGSVTLGESSISNASTPIRRVYLEPANPAATPEAVQALAEADAIVLGPGSLYTSIIPNLLAEGIVPAIVQSKALKIYVCNVMTQFRETTGYRASDHVKALVMHSNPGILQVCIVNTTKAPSPLLEKYLKEGAYPVESDIEQIRHLGYQVMAEDVLDVHDYVRHNSAKVAHLIIQLISGIRRPFFLSASTKTAPRHPTPDLPPPSVQPAPRA